MSENKEPKKFRNFASILYFDSAPSDWADRLYNLHIKAFISPVHDKDIKENGEFKKPHCHIMLMYDSPVSPNIAQSDFANIGALSAHIEILKSKQGYARYLCHLDDKNKAQYDTEEVIALAGANYHDTIYLEEDRVTILAEILRFVDDNQIINYTDFIRYCLNNNTTWLAFISRNVAVSQTIKEFQKSVFWGIKNGIPSNTL